MKDNKQADLIALCCTLVLISTLVILLRCWAIKISDSNRHFGWDDGFAIATLPAIVLQNAVVMYAVSRGLGKHSTSVALEDLSAAPVLIFVVSFISALSITLPKLSALFFYFRIFQRTHRWFLILLWIIGSLCILWLLASWVLAIAQCEHVADVFQAGPRGYCIPQWKLFLGTAVPSTVLDLLILLLPLPLLAGLQVSFARKCLVITVFVCGYCVIIVSIGRLVAIAHTRDNIEDDPSWSLISYVKWLQCEAPISVISVSLPTCFQLIKKTFEKYLQTVTSVRSTSRHQLHPCPPQDMVWESNKDTRCHEDVTPLESARSASATAQALSCDDNTLVPNSSGIVRLSLDADAIDPSLHWEEYPNAHA